MNAPIGIFLTRPGDGEEYVYSPVKVNATLSCVVNNTFLLWGINETYYNVLPSSLTSRGIFLRLSAISSDGRAESLLLVMGNINKNNDTRICCRALMEQDSCTTLIIYGTIYNIIIFRFNLTYFYTRSTLST